PRQQAIIERVLAAAAGSYLLGAIPTSQLVAKHLAGIDLRAVGSGNLGATNLYRVLGWKFAVPVATFDLAKGAIPVVAFAPWADASLVGALFLGAAAVFGHIFSVFANFSGGKGVATSAGVLLALAPVAFAGALALWAAVLAASGYVSLASIIAAIALPPALWFLEPSRHQLVWWFTGIAALVVWMHRANIRRLVNGTEHRFGRRVAAVRPHD
ncbi:MAG: glycerol-3-phosphate 1-O-acyltransferase PlsY, partial [Gemmatimonadales bacterium]